MNAADIATAATARGGRVNVVTWNAAPGTGSRRSLPNELKTMVEELAEDPPSGVNRDRIEALQQAIEKARDIADDLENQSW